VKEDNFLMFLLRLLGRRKWYAKVDVVSESRGRIRRCRAELAIGEGSPHERVEKRAEIVDLLMGIVSETEAPRDKAELRRAKNSLFRAQLAALAARPDFFLGENDEKASLGSFVVDVDVNQE